MLSMEMLKKIAKSIEEAEDFDNAMEETKEEVKKSEKNETSSHIHTKAMSSDDLITQNRTIYDVELVDHKYWIENGRLYMSLRYKVATDVGDVDLLYSKIRMPFIVDHLPKLETTDDGRLLLRADDCMFYLCETKHPDYPSLDEAYVFEHMEKPPEREMTVAEIEKELGYKVKVVGGPYDKREK